MEPLINNPGHLQALKNYVEAVAYGPPGMVNYDSGDVRSAFAAGKAVLAIDWDDTGIVAELTPGSKARGKTASMLLPGSTKVWDYRKNAWVTMSTPNRPAWLAFNGWKGGIPNSTPKKDAAYNFISFLASPKISLEEVTMAGSGMNPYRYEHFTNRAAWVKAGYPSSGKDLDEYLRAMYDCETSSNAVTDLRIPGAASFQDAVELNTSRAAAKQTSPQDALNAIANAWKGINARYGTKRQIQAFKASNAPIKAPLNKSTPPTSIPSYLK
jgi:multiple sugar transport system substrate-binding protein